MPGYKVWVDDEEVDAAGLNGYIQSQVIPRFTSTANRDAQLTAPEAGQECYVTGIGKQIHNGTTWTPTPGTAVALLRQTTAQSIAASTSTDITFQTADLDLLNGHSTTTNPHLYTPTIPGWYEVRATCTFASNATGYRGVDLYLNAGILAGNYQAASPSTTSFPSVPATLVYFNGTTDTLKLRVIQTSGVALLTVIVAGYQPNLHVKYLGP